MNRQLVGLVSRTGLMPQTFYSRIQLLNRAQGHSSEVYCVLFDRTGQYIFSVCQVGCIVWPNVGHLIFVSVLCFRDLTTV